MVRAQDVVPCWDESCSLQFLEPLLQYTVLQWEFVEAALPSEPWVYLLLAHWMVITPNSGAKAWHCDLRILILNVRLFHCWIPLKSRITSMKMCQLFRKSSKSPLLSWDDVSRRVTLWFAVCPPGGAAVISVINGVIHGGLRRVTTQQNQLICSQSGRCSLSALPPFFSVVACAQ